MASVLCSTFLLLLVFAGIITNFIKLSIISFDYKHNKGTNRFINHYKTIDRYHNNYKMTIQKAVILLILSTKKKNTTDK